MAESAPEFSEEGFNEIKRILDEMVMDNIKTYDIFGDILDIVRYLQGNLTDCFTKLEFYKSFLYVSEY